MDIPSEWLFPSSISAAEEAQRLMARKVVKEDAFSSPQSIGGMDVSNNLYDPAQMVYASAVVLNYPKLEIIEQATAAQKQEFSYIPGLLGFRESPVLIKAFKSLHKKPDLLFIDGHGISHPRGLGIASHVGVLLDIPTIGVAKSILVGHPAATLDDEPGSQVLLQWKGQCIGMLIRSKARSNPLIISIGHRISLESAVQLVRSCLKGYRLPEPTRQAHLLANACRRSYTISP